MLKLQLVVPSLTLREALYGLFAPEPDIVLVEEGGGFGFADVVLVDDEPRREDAITLIRCIRRIHPRTRAIMMLSAPTHETVREALSAGASGVVAKAQPTRELLGAVRVVGQGASYLCPNVFALAAR